MRTSRLFVALPAVVATIILADAGNNTSPSLGQEEPVAERAFDNGPRHSADIVARLDGEVTQTNKTDTAIVVAASITDDDLKRSHTQHKRSDSTSKPKKKKPPKKGNHTNSTGEEDDDDSGVGRGITLPISLAIGLVLVVGALHM
ncbi:hypothetical protein EV127DRAFT_173170 [Xylaria flabelliformis]|nr:hypothetical protein EV127DRAFT_173170 [Xylaria flabelliformis]